MNRPANQTKTAREYERRRTWLLVLSGFQTGKARAKTLQEVAAIDATLRLMGAAPGEIYETR